MKNVSYIVEPRSALSIKVIHELWFFRRLIWMFIWRDILVRYKNTLIGGLWYVTQPVAMMIIFTVFFSAAFKGFIGDVPYPIFSYSGLLLWQMFSRSLTLGAGSMIAFEPILGKIYFPRLIAPLSLNLGTLFDFFVASLVLVGMMFYYGVEIRITILLVPLILLMTLMCSIGFSCFLAAIDARFRDVRHTIPLLVQLWMFSTPIMYPSSYIAGRWQSLYELNPMVGLTEWFRWLMFQVGNEPSISSLQSAAIMSVVVFVVGIVVFQKMQGTVVDTL